MKLRLKSIARMTRQMATYLDSFVDIRKALESLANSSSDYRMSKSLIRVRGRIIEGDDLFEAFAGEGNRYPNLFLRMTKVGEESGTLADVYRQLAQYFEERVAMRSRFFYQILYPCFMVTALIVILALLKAVSQSMSISGGLDWNLVERLFLINLAWNVGFIAAIIVALYVVRFLFWGRSITDAFLFFVPFLGAPFRKAMLARFSFSLGLMSGSAIPLPEAVSESGKATNNGYAAYILDKASVELTEGSQLTPVLEGTRLFPVDFINIVEVAEESGKLAESLQRVSIHYIEDADLSMKRLLTTLSTLIYLSIMLIMTYHIITMWAGYIGGMGVT